MSDLSDEERPRQTAIREILLRQWDPIGVASVSEAQDEYDAYVAGVHSLLARRADVADVFKYLWWAETEHMALRGDSQRTQRIAEKLVALNEKVTVSKG